MERTSLPPGFRFHPTDVELVMYYLKRKLMGVKPKMEVISELNLYKFSPWDLPDESCLRSKDLEWFFFCPREKKYACGGRTNRATEKGYWKTTGKDRPITYKERTVGMVKTLVFHLGHAPRGDRTDWVMHEYRFVDTVLADAGISQDAFVLCKVFQKSGPGPKNGAQYGAPFNEEDWDDDENIIDESSIANHLPSAVIEPSNDQNEAVVSTVVHQSNGSWSLTDPGRPTAEPPTKEALNVVSGNDDISSYLAMFTEKTPLATGYKETNNNNCVYTGLENLGSWGGLDGSGFAVPNRLEGGYGLNSVPVRDNASFLELTDLEIPLNRTDHPDTVSRQHNLMSNSSQLLYTGDSLGSALHPVAINQSTPLPNGSCWQESNLNPSYPMHLFNGSVDGASQGYGYGFNPMALALAPTGEHSGSSRNAANPQGRGLFNLLHQ